MLWKGQPTKISLENIIIRFFSAFRTVLGRQTTLLKIIEDWKKVIRRK